MSSPCHILTKYRNSGPDRPATALSLPNSTRELFGPTCESSAVEFGKRSATGERLRRGGVEALGTEGERDSAQAAVRVEVAQLSGHVPNAIAAGQRRQRQRCQHT